MVVVEVTATAGRRRRWAASKSLEWMTTDCEVTAMTLASRCSPRQRCQSAVGDGCVTVQEDSGVRVQSVAAVSECSRTAVSGCEQG